MKKLVSLVAVSFVMALTLSACNTMEGAGQDIQKGGQKLEDAANKKK